MRSETLGVDLLVTDEVRARFNLTYAALGMGWAADSWVLWPWWPEPRWLRVNLAAFTFPS